MSNRKEPASERMWAAIEDEKRRDRFLKRVTVVAWSVTFAIVLIFTVMMGIQVTQVWNAMGAIDGGGPQIMAMIGVATPLIIVLGFLSVLIATLSTIGMFVRMRTASLTEIQQRLAALEDILTGDAKTGDAS